MTSRESSLGAWADKLPQVDGWTGEAPPQEWEQACAEPEPISPDELAHDLKNAGILLLMGFAVLLLAGGLLALNLRVVLYGEKTTGEVVDHRHARRGTYVPVAAFYVDGERYLVRGGTSSDKAAYDIGEPVSVIYLPDDPDQAVIGGFFQLYLFPTVFGVIGTAIMLFALGCGAYVLRKPRLPAAAS
jgi:hypothetical protein